jgi:hypothetical protein
MARLVVRGIVRDEAGVPIEGAAVDLNGEVVYTNSGGQFFLRTKHPAQYSVKVRLGEFLLPGEWEVVNAPETATAAEESRAVPIAITLRRPGSAVQ